tara:strand:- start:132 stop:308 length:177 start_codon:yes stop_codon:yes gene_type:complete
MMWAGWIRRRASLSAIRRTSWNELMRGMSPFIRHRMVLIGAMAAPEGAAYGECPDAVD